MQIIKRSHRSSSILSFGMLAGLALVALLWLPGQVLGQGQWTTNGNDISNTNAGNVGIGTTAPGDLLEVRKGQNGGTLIRVDNPDSTSPAAYAGFSFYQNGVRRSHVVSVNDGCATCLGGAGAMQLFNFANTNMIFGTNSAERMRITNAGNVGVGTTSPLSLFTVGNNPVVYAQQSAGVRIETTSAGNTYDRGLAVFPLQTAPAAGNSILIYAYPRIASGVTQPTQYGLYVDANQGAGAITNYYPGVFMGGNVGVGTTTPAGQLEVKSAANVHNALYLNTTTAGYADSIVFQEAGTIKASIQHNPSVLSGALLFNTGGGSSPANTSMVINAAGSVGVGTTSPGYRLDVQGGQINASGGLCIAGDCKTAWSQVGGTGGSSPWTTSGTNIFYNSGNVGIGTTTPSYRLHIVGDNTASGGFPLIKLQNTQAGGHSYWLYSGANGIADDFGIYDENTSAFRLYVKGSGNVGIGTSSPNDKLDVAGNIRMSSGYYLSAVGGNLKLNADTVNDIEFYQNGVVKAGIYDGNLGIGTTAPTAKLDVQGDINVSGNINAKYQDVAEWVTAGRALPAGTVVVLNAGKSNQVLPSAKAYDTRVAGVVSEKPGLALGEPGKDKVLVATTGRVRVKVDATRAPIEVGDLLVTSDVEGVAMKSVPVSLSGVEFHRPGTLLGKALEPLERGQGEILVLLSLQ